MLQGLFNVSPSAVLFVRQFHGSPWENDTGEVCDTDQAEGGVILPWSAQPFGCCPSQTSRRRTHLSPLLTGCLPSTQFQRKSCGTRVFETTMARPKFGNRPAGAFWTEPLVHLILSFLQGGKEKESPLTKASGFCGRLWAMRISSGRSSTALWMSMLLCWNGSLQSGTVALCQCRCELRSSCGAACVGQALLSMGGVGFAQCRSHQQQCVLGELG